MGGNTANPAPHGPLRRTLSCYALIPLVLLVGGLAIGGAMLVQGLARVGQRLGRWEVALQWIGLGVMLTFGVLQRGGPLCVLGAALAAAALFPPALLGGRLLGLQFEPATNQRFPLLALFLGLLLVFSPLVALIGVAVIGDFGRWFPATLMLPPLLAFALVLARVEERKPTFRPISVKHTK